MRASREIESRLKAILSKDKIELKSGFLSALNGDLNKLMSDYFELSELSEVAVEQNDEGGFSVSFSANAKKIKSFDSTADLRRY